MSPPASEGLDEPHPGGESHVRLSRIVERVYQMYWLSVNAIGGRANSLPSQSSMRSFMLERNGPFKTGVFRVTVRTMSGP